MFNLENDVLQYLPLIIEEIEWDYSMLLLKGKDWTFYTVCGAWRICKAKIMLSGSTDENSLDILGLLKIRPIKSIQMNKFDPIFYFEDEYTLEIFSTTYIEPWIFYLPNRNAYMVSPDEGYV